MFVSEDLYPHVLRAMNFGFSSAGTPGVCREGHRACSNWRMSDIAAAAVLCHLERVSKLCWITRYTGLLQHAFSTAAELGVSLQPPCGLQLTTPTIIPCLFVSLPTHWHGRADEVILRLTSLPVPIEAKQYYRPLATADAAPLAWQLFNSTVCLPFHLDLTPADVDYMLTQLAAALAC